MRNKLLLSTLVLSLGMSCSSTPTTLSAPEQPAKQTKKSAQQEQTFDFESSESWKDDIDSLMVAGSHILVAHRDSKATDQMVSDNTVTRTREEALRKAWSLYKELSAHPEQYTEVAKRESNDRNTAWAGGSLGVVYAKEIPFELVDAFIHLPFGKLSKPIETEQGYHLLRSAKPPPETEVAMAHIVIKHEEAFGWRRLDKPVPKRTRLQARALAKRVALESQQHPERFGRLALQYSDGDNALREGDLGPWSTYEDAGQDFLLLSVASQLPVGGVSDVVETGTGAHVIMRKPLVAKQPLAASIIVIGYQGSQLSRLNRDGKRSRQDAKELANKLAIQLQNQPHTFEQLRDANCDPGLCESVLSWNAGRGMGVLEREITKLTVNSTSPMPVDSPLGYIIIRREDPRKHPVPVRSTPHFSFINSTEQKTET